MRSKKAVWNVSLNLLAQVVIIIFGFVVPRIIIEKYGSETNGLVASITQFLGYITLLESGFGPVVKSVLYKPLARKNHQKITNILRASEKFFRVIAGIFLIYLLIIACLYPLIVNNQFDYFFTFSLVLIIAISIFAEYYFGMAYRLFLQADQKSYVVSIIQIVSYVLSIIAVIILAQFNVPVHVLKLATGLLFILRPILQNIYVKKKYQIKLTEANQKYSIKQKWDGLAQHVAAVVHNNTDIAILTFFSTLLEVSVYAVYNLVLKGVKALIEAATNGLTAAFGDMIAKKETHNLQKRFSNYEALYLTIATIIYICTLVLITPFVAVYTNGISDTNYVRWGFGVIIVLSEFIWAIRLPYSSIALAAGHFKQTRKGAWVEAGVNTTLSVLLVWQFGLVGVAIGTLVAMLIRTIEFIYHTNKYVLHRSLWQSFKKIFIIIIETLLLPLLLSLLPITMPASYFDWFIYAIIVFGITTIVVFVINVILYKSDFQEILKVCKRMIRRKK